ncbi:hypothetical protein ACFL6X_02250 [Candidatus Latescibacterota bacterium]
MTDSHSDSRWLFSEAGSAGSYLVTTDACEVLGASDAWERLQDAYRKWVDLGAPGRGAYRSEVWSPEAIKRAPRDGWLLRRPQSQMVVRLKH